MQTASEPTTFPALRVSEELGDHSPAVAGLALAALENPTALSDVRNMEDLRRILEQATHTAPCGAEAPVLGSRKAILLIALLDLAHHNNDQAEVSSLRDRVLRELDGLADLPRHDGSWDFAITLLIRAGFRDDARALRQSLHDRRMFSTPPVNDGDAMGYRARALELFEQGQYQSAEIIYRHLLTTNWERPSNFVHLARVRFALGSPPEDIEAALEGAWELRSEAPSYVICRIHFARALLATLRNHDAGPHLRVLAESLREPRCRLSWHIEPVLIVLRERIGQAAFEFFTSLARTINQTDAPTEPRAT